MSAKPFDTSKLPSRHVTEGPSRAPHRSYDYAIGLTEEQIHRPFVGVVSCWNEAAPLAKRRKAWKASAHAYQSGAIRKFADQVGPAHKGAVTHAGGKAEVVCYADI
jgi:dihydroxy-acid dehydratase